MIDLHLHLNGSLPVDLVLELAKLQKVDLPTFDKSKLKKMISVPSDCQSLNDYLKCTALPKSLVQTKKAVSYAVYGLLESLKKQGLIYAEIRFAPQNHMAKGLTQEEVVVSAIEGLHKSSLKANLILCCMRGIGKEEQNLETLRLAKKYLNKGVCAIDLAGAESLYKTEDYAYIFKHEDCKNIPITIHAGEADGPQSVKSAISFGVKRIGHGIRSVQDKYLIQEIIDKQVVLEICPTSNYNTKAINSFKENPIKKFFDMGVKVTVNTDNMTISNTNLQKEFKLLKKEFNFSNEEIFMMINNSIDAAFISKEEKEELKKIAKERKNEYLKKV